MWDVKQTLRRRCFLSSPEMSSEVQLYQQSPKTGGSARGLQEGKPGGKVMGGSPSCSYKIKDLISIKYLRNIIPMLCKDKIHSKYFFFLHLYQTLTLTILPIARQSLSGEWPTAS